MIRFWDFEEFIDEHFAYWVRNSFVNYIASNVSDNMSNMKT